MGRLSQREIDDLLNEPYISIVCTLRPDGTPHMSPVWHLMEEDQVVIAVEESSVKARNVRNDPRVALCVGTDEKPQRWVQVNGTATLSKDRVPGVVRSLSLHYMGAEEGEPYADEVLKQLDFTLMRITPTGMLGFDGKE